MRFVFHNFPVGLLVLFTLVLTGSTQAQAQPVQEEITTEDGVKLAATWYQANKPNPPVVMILHDLGEDSGKAEWVNLATALQKDGFAVLAFDFRGHGRSVVANKSFWFPQYNAANKLAKAPMGAQLNFKNFDKSYYRFLVNDISAAKAFLDQKNDNGQCNSSSVILVGAGEGANLGSIWLNSEWHRYRCRMVGFAQWVPDATPVYGNNVVACVWLSYNNRLAAGAVGKEYRLEPKLVFRKSAIENTTPMLFFHNAKDALDKAIAEHHEKMIKDANKDFDPKFTKAMPVENVGKLKGRELLNAQGMIGAIVDYVKLAPTIIPRKTQDISNNQFMWIGDPPQIWSVPINSIGALTFGFHDYARFMPK
jgi:hypothetical protein